MKSRSFIPALRFKPLTPLYDFLSGRFFPEKKIKQGLIDQLQLKGDETILDFGCGTGTLAIMLKEQYSMATIIGVDIDEQILAIARKKIDAKGLNVQLEKYDGQDLSSLGAKRFDKIVSTLVFHHISTKGKRIVLKQLLLLLKPSGELCIADFGKGKTLYAKIATELFKRFDGIESTSVNANGLLPEFIRAAGFKNVQHVRDYNTAFGTINLLKASAQIN